MPDAVPRDLTINKVVDATTVVPEVDDEVLMFSHEGGTNDSIWIDMEAPIMRASDGRHAYVLTQPEHAATDDRFGQHDGAPRDLDAAPKKVAAVERQLGYAPIEMDFSKSGSRRSMFIGSATLCAQWINPATGCDETVEY